MGQLRGVFGCDREVVSEETGRVPLRFQLAQTGAPRPKLKVKPRMCRPLG